MTKQELINKYEDVDSHPRLIVTVVTLPSGAFEVITNYEYLDDKINYLLSIYDDNLVMKSNPSIRLLDCIIL